MYNPKRVCQPKTVHDIHKSLCAKPVIERSKYELSGPFGKYRDENYQAYKRKCDEFKSKVKAYKDENLKALQNHRKRLGDESFQMKEQYENVNEVNEVKTEEIWNDGSNGSLLWTKKEFGVAHRKRHERSYDDTKWDPNEKLCNYEPWFRRYLILCKFITAVRKVIVKNRLLKILAKLKLVTNDLVQVYESEYVKFEQLSYPDLFQKFI